jgi:predicted DNA-binding transcriptional regulator YafY
VAWWAATGLRDAEIGEPGDDGWVPISVPAGVDDALASWVLGFGPDARVVEPSSLRDEVVRRLEALLAG